MPEPAKRNGEDPEVRRVLQTLQRPTLDEREVESLVHGASQPMLILDGDGHVLAVNARAEALVEKEAGGLRGRPFATVLPPEERALVRERIREAIRTRQGPSDVPMRIRTAAGALLPATLTFLPFTAAGLPRLALLVREDAADEAAAPLAPPSKKLSDLGGLLSGVAHEIRSPVQYIENLAHLSETQARRAIERHPEAAADLEQLRANAELIRDGAQRIRHLLQELQPLTRNRPTRKAPVDLAVLVADAVRTFEGSARGPHARIELDLQATHPVELDIEEMSRVLLNLIKNASEAMGGKGRIRIRTLNRDFPPQVRVEDEGPGIPPDARLFEPFYTTKKDGTGLGLAISKRIVEAHGGRIWHERNERGGATFVVQLPALTGQEG